MKTLINVVITGLLIASIVAASRNQIDWATYWMVYAIFGKFMVNEW